MLSTPGSEAMRYAPAADLYVDQQAFESVFASGLPKSQSIVMSATQRPLAASALSERAPAPGWKTIPS
jgi:hypothetical protein